MISKTTNLLFFIKIFCIKILIAFSGTFAACLKLSPFVLSVSKICTRIFASRLSMQWQKKNENCVNFYQPTDPIFHPLTLMFLCISSNLVDFCPFFALLLCCHRFTIRIRDWMPLWAFLTWNIFSVWRREKNSDLKK